MTRPRSGRFNSLFVVLPLIALLALAGPATAQWPPEVKNLKHFPEDIDFRELMANMRSFAFGLGVRCQYCHVGEEGQPLSSFDFASDEKETKQKARAMLAMVEVINNDHLAKLNHEEGSEGLRVQCVTCHRGTEHPEQLRDILVRTSSEGGDAVAKYRELREEFYGSGTYNFSPDTLVRAAEALAATNADGAVALLEESLSHEPESSWALGTLAGIEMQRGNKEAAIEALKKILAFEPDNQRVKQQIERLMAPPEPSSGAGEGRF